MAWAPVNLLVDDDQLLGAIGRSLSSMMAAADESAAAVVERMCDWTSNYEGSQLRATHDVWHSGYVCPYAAMAAVLRGQPDPRPNHRVDHLMWWGEDNQWIVARGHLDLEQFAADADALARRDGDGRVPSEAGEEPRHGYVRPASQFDDERFEWCSDDAAGAFAITVVDTE